MEHLSKIHVLAQADEKVCKTNLAPTQEPKQGVKKKNSIIYRIVERLKS